MQCLSPKRLVYIIFIVHVHLTSSADVTDMDRLYSYIFQNYSRKTLPVMNSSTPVYVGMTGYIINLNKFDELSGELSVTVGLRMEWTEERIRWNISDYNNISYLAVCPEDIWKPLVYLLQSTDTVRDFGNTSIQPLIFADGTVVWIASAVLRVSFSVDVTDFPFDIQMCNISIINWFYSKSALVLYPKDTVIHTDYFSQNSQWEIQPSMMDNCTYIQDAPCVQIKLILKRRTKFFVFYIIIPLELLGLINNLVFAMPPSCGERTSVAVTVFLSFVVYMGIVNDVLPQSSEPMAIIYYFIVFLLMYSCIILFLCIISLRIYDKKTDVPPNVCKIASIISFRWVRRQKRVVSDVQRSHCSLRSFADDIANDEIQESPKIQLNDENKQLQTVQKWDSSEQGKVSDFVWKDVGKLFDFYCCVTLYAMLIICSVTISSMWGSRTNN